MYSLQFRFHQTNSNIISLSYNIIQHHTTSEIQTHQKLNNYKEPIKTNPFLLALSAAAVDTKPAPTNNMSKNEATKKHENYKCKQIHTKSYKYNQIYTNTSNHSTNSIGKHSSTSSTVVLQSFSDLIFRTARHRNRLNT